MIEINRKLLLDIGAVAQAAGELIVQQQVGPEDIQLKADQSPLTIADRLAHESILRNLENSFPGVPVLSEESGSDILNGPQRIDWSEYWLVDPLDGTKDFLAGRDHFTVNIALIRSSAPVAGVIYAPKSLELFLGARGLGAFKQTGSGELAAVSCRVPEDPSRPHCLISRSHESKEAKMILDHWPEATIERMGSSLKFCRIASGEADFHFRLTPTSEWDTAAAQSIVEAAGGTVVDHAGCPLSYNKPDSLLNPPLATIGAENLSWSALLRKK